MADKIDVARLARELDSRITEYMTRGGLWNPEAMNHDDVRDLMIDCHRFVRAALAAPEPSREPTREQVEAWARELGASDGGADLLEVVHHGCMTVGWLTRFAALAYAAGHKAENQSPTWQRIETAPKDESIILLGYVPHPRLEDSRRVYEGRWNLGQEQFTSTNGFMGHADATHWMPLPPPPKAGSRT